MSEARDGLRLDKWLWQARFCKSRGLAQALCRSGRLRVNKTAVAKPHQTVRAGDVLTFPLGPHVRVIRILALGGRRGPATEARTLYEDLAPPPERRPEPGLRPAQSARRPAGAGRPTKRERRAIDRLRGA